MKELIPSEHCSWFGNYESLLIQQYILRTLINLKLEFYTCDFTNLLIYVYVIEILDEQTNPILNLNRFPHYVLYGRVAIIILVTSLTILFLLLRTNRVFSRMDNFLKGKVDFVNAAIQNNESFKIYSNKLYSFSDADSSLRRGEENGT